MTRRPPMMRRLIVCSSSFCGSRVRSSLRSAVAHRSTASSSRAARRAERLVERELTSALACEDAAVARHQPMGARVAAIKAHARRARAACANRSEVAVERREIGRSRSRRAQQSESERCVGADEARAEPCASIERLGGHRSIHMRQAEGYFATAEKVLVGMRLRGYLAHLRKGLPNATPRRASRRALLPITT